MSAQRMTARLYLEARGWFFTGIPARDTVPCYCDPLHPEYDAIDEGYAVLVQRARDAQEERRCAADAIANAASRHCKRSDELIVAELAERAGKVARHAWCALFAVEIVDEPEAQS